MELEKSHDNSGEDEILGSSLTMEKVAAAKKYIENHYKNQMKNIQERKERYANRLVLLFCIFEMQLTGVAISVVFVV